MLSSLFRRVPELGRMKRPVEVGWVLQTEKAGFIWPSPQPVRRGDEPPRHAKAAGRCPAVIDHESRLLEVTCPFDLHLRFAFNEKEEPAIYDAAAEHSGFNPRTLAQTVSVMPRTHWRHPERPIFQIHTPYRFLSDETVYATQLPPFLRYREEPWPGVLIGGRMPIHIWPRKLNWAFEWHNIKRDLVLTRGEPWFLLHFEGPDGSQPVRVVEAELTKDLVGYFAGLDGVVDYVNRTFSLLPVAQERRPARLLVPRRR